MRLKLLSLFTIFVLLFSFGCGKEKTAFKIDYESYTLDNGMEVILHDDKSDPIVAVAIQYHVGSNREVKGRTGFAHLFEHMMFQESQHVGQDQFFKKIQSAGGTLNGGTSNDGTIYFEVVPKNALEMVLWLESDRLGFLLSKVTQDAFANQQEVVKNEKRQMVDNRPYGHLGYIVDKLLYPENHPYNWQVIGSMEDLTGATLKDVRDFYQKWYVPNNATLVVAGDFDHEITKAWIEKYFGEIKTGGSIIDPEPQPVSLIESRRAYYEDNFARSPQLQIIFPTVEGYNGDDYALQFLGEILSGSKKSPLYKVLVEEKKLAPSAASYQSGLEIAGTFNFSVQAFPSVKLGDVETAIFEALARFEEEGCTEEDLDRIKASTETSFYNGMSSILGKSFQLARYNEYAGSPGFITEDLEQTLKVTKEDIMRVYRTYIKDKPFVLTCVVPRGKTDLLAENCQLFPLVEEKLADQTQVAQTAAEAVDVQDLPTSFDRSIEPPQGPDPELNIPSVWKSELANGIKVYGIEHHELPLVQFTLNLKGGMLLDEPQKVGTAYLVSRLMMEGTKNKTPIQLQEAIDALGARISVSTGQQSISIRGNCLVSKLAQVYSLIEEILLEPRWDEKEFNRIKNQTIEGMNRNAANPAFLARNVFSKLVYGQDHILSNSTSGTIASLNLITIDDLKAYYARNFSPGVSYLTVVGDVTKEGVEAVFNTLADKWQAKEVTFPSYPIPDAIGEATIYFVDVPGAKQSVINIGYLALPYNHEDFYPVTVMNYKLGGSFNSVFNMILREEKGYTYGARSGFSGGVYPGPFSASSSVQSTATLDSVKIFHDEMVKYREGITADDLTFTKDSLIKSNARRFETLGGIMGMLSSIASYGLPDDFIKKQEEFVRGLSLSAHKDLAQKYIVPERMVYVVVGDAATQMSQLEELGFAAVVQIDKDGNRVEDNE